mgnify:CR=1 FL=1
MGEAKAYDWSQESEAETNGGHNRTVRSSSNTDVLSSEFSQNEILEVLRNRRRRLVIYYLLDNGGEAAVGELTEYVAVDEYDTSTDEMSSDQRKRVYTGLYQFHLPRLDEIEVIDLDTEANVISLGAKATAIEPYLPRESNSTTAHIELAIALFVSPLVTLGVLGVGPLDAVPLLLWAGLTILVLLGLALLQQYNLS